MILADKMNLKFYSITTLIVSLLFITSCTKSDELYSLKGGTMGTTFSVLYITKNISKKSVQDSVYKALEEINDKMSTFRKSSELSKINRNESKEWIKVSDKLYNVLSSAKSVSDLTEDGFDVTVGPIVNLWGFGPDGERKVPTRNAIDNAMSKSGIRKLLIDTKMKRIKKLKAGLYIDLSAIAKGFGVDIVAKSLDKLKIENYMVEVGGEVKTKGHKFSRPWRIAVESPNAQNGNYQKVLNLTDMAVATSGNYRNYFKADGKRYSHTINPKTGFPVKHSLASVTIVDEASCMKADAIATGMMVLGYEKGMQVAEDHGIAAYFIYEKDGQFKVTSSTKFRKLFGD